MIVETGAYLLALALALAAALAAVAATSSRVAKVRRAWRGIVPQAALEKFIVASPQAMVAKNERIIRVRAASPLRGQP